ncbi:hypothetical protein [Butyrivibrio sp. AE2032]|uniref:hypothetical protein n=1 Tax=Butyrivibrio sp. AE2032 TaxID=1458463 RepID=UPI000556D0C7|nr:hypothetical protein [Butyrivibrio sp. AE2032]
MKKYLKENWIYYALVLASVICFFYPFFIKGFVEGSEFGFHYTRIHTLVDSLKLGIFPAKLRPMHMKLYGYGVGFFYPDFFIYPPAVLVALGLDYEIVLKTYLFIVILIGTLAAFHCFSHLAGNKVVGLFSEILLLCSVINDVNLFGGSGIPHLFAYLAIPVTLCGLLMALKDEKKGYTIYVIGLTSVVLSHHLIFLTMLLVMVIVVLVHIGDIIKKPAAFGKIMGISLAALVFTTAYWLPALEQATRIKLIALYDNGYNLTDHILTLKELVFQHIGLHYALLFVAAFFLFLFLVIKGRKMGKDIWSFFIVNPILIFLICSKWFWSGSIGQTLNFFQYTERFDFTFTVTIIIFINLVLGEAVREFNISLPGEKRWSKLATALVMLVVMFAARNYVRPGFLDPSTYPIINPTPALYAEDYQVSFAEWLPIECEPSECKTPNTSYADDGSSAEGIKSEGAVYYDAWVLLDKKYYDVPYVYYYGYHAYLLDDNGNPVQELEVGEAFDDNGYVRVFMPEGGSGVGMIRVTYRKTTLQKVSYAISALATLVILGLVVMRRHPRISIQEQC